MLQKTFTASGQHVLGFASDHSMSKWTIAIDVGAGANVSVRVQGRLYGSGLGYQNIAYTDMADGAQYSAAIIADALIQVEASGMEVQLDVTWTSGTVTIYATPSIG